MVRCIMNNLARLAAVLHEPESASQLDNVCCPLICAATGIATAPKLLLTISMLVALLANFHTLAV